MRKLIVLVLVAMAAALGFQAASSFASDDVFHGGDVVYTKPVKAVLFSHKSHVEDTGMSCDMCHSGLFEMASLSAQQNDDFTMQSLYDGKYCGACHNGSFAFSSDSQCARCHIGVKGYQARMGKSAEEKGQGH